jgi:isoleucyl-tRNA synthetase
MRPRLFRPLWYTYAFFLTYARLDGWTPDQADRVDGARSLLDRWILSRLDGLVSEVGGALDGYDAMRAARAIETFVDDLSNWYIRRNRRRFWKGELDADKRAAHSTLHEVLTTLCRLLAPIVPHLADAMWHNLVTSVDASRPDSVHLADWPTPLEGRRDAPIEAAIELGRRTVALGRSARAASGVRTRQPLRAVRVKLPAAADGQLSPDASIDAEVRAQVLEELNVRAIEPIGDEAEMVERSLYPLLPVLGPRHGKAVGAIMAGARGGEWRANADGTATVAGIVLQADEFELTARARPGHEVAEDGDLLVALDTALDEELEAAGFAREVAHRLQALRREPGLEISDSVVVSIGLAADAAARLEPHLPWLRGELLATEMSVGLSADLPGTAGGPGTRASVELDGETVELAVARA